MSYKAPYRSCNSSGSVVVPVGRDVRSRMVVKDTSVLTLPRFAFTSLLLTLIALSGALTVLLCFYVNFNSCITDDNCVELGRTGMRKELSEGLEIELARKKQGENLVDNLYRITGGEHENYKETFIEAMESSLPEEGSEKIQSELRPMEEKKALYIGIISDIHLAVMPDKECQTTAIYGLYGCDSNEALVNATLEDMRSKITTKSNHIVFMIGDAAKHQEVETWKPDVALDNNERFYQLLGEKLKGIPVFPILGNNDLPEHNELPPISWYANFLAYFQNAVQPAETATSNSVRVTIPDDFDESILSGGYYSALVQSTDHVPLTVIALNTVLFHCKPHAIEDQKYQATDQLAWLYRKMVTSERVVVIGHHPPNMNFARLTAQNRLLPDWRAEYYERFRDVLEKFQSKVVGMFFGHEHINMVVAESWASGTMGMFGVPSIAPSFAGEPSYQVATLDSLSMAIRDIETYNTWLDLTSSPNKILRFLGYSSLVDTFGTTDISFKNIAEKIKTLRSNEKEAMVLYQKLKNRMFSGRSFPKTMNRQLFFCYSKSSLTRRFLQCVESFGYTKDDFLLN